MDYQWLVFDADNTLLDFTRSARIAFSETIESIGLAFDDRLFDIYHEINLECWADLEAGRITPGELKIRRFSQFLDQVGKPGDPAKMNSIYFEVLKRATYTIDGAVEVLGILSQKGYRMAVATNGLADVQRPRLAEAGIGQFFQEILVSEEIGYFKPNPGFFHTVIQRLQARETDRLLMIGDNMYSDIEAAKKAGWDTCWYNPRGEDNPLAEAPDFTIGRLHQLLDILA